MALDMDMLVKVRRRPPADLVKRLQYDMMHRFGLERFYGPNEDPTTRSFITIEKFGDGSFGMRFMLRGRLYLQGYERGDGLKGAAMILYLIRTFPDAEVWYGCDGLKEYGEDLLERYDENKALDLLMHFIDFGKLPFIREMTEVLNSEDGVESPECLCCGVPMFRNNMDEAKATFYCEGCGKKLELVGDARTKWRKKGDKLKLGMAMNIIPGKAMLSEYDPSYYAADSEEEENSPQAIATLLARRRLMDCLEVYLSSRVPDPEAPVFRIPEIFKSHIEIVKIPQTDCSEPLDTES